MQTLEDGQYHACHQDEKGSTIYITGRDGAVENCYVYDAFGNTLEKKEGIQNRIQYTGQQYDQETGQYYLRARYYNPIVGRFTQEDTYRGDGLNLYAYCKNNPVLYYDPSGHNLAAKPSNGPETTNTSGVEKENLENLPAVVESGNDTTSTQLSRRELAERKLADAAKGSRAEGVLIGKDGDVPVYQSQQQLKESLLDAGAEYVKPAKNNDGQIYHMETPNGAVEIRIMQEKPDKTGKYSGNRTIIVKQGTVGQGSGTYTYGNGARISGTLSKSDRRAIGHTHGQIP